MDSVHEIIKEADILKFYATSIWEEKKRLHAQGEKASNSVLSEGRDILSILRMPSVVSRSAGH